MKKNEVFSSAFLPLLVLHLLAFSPSSIFSEPPSAENDYGRSHPKGLSIPWKSILQGDGLAGWNTALPNQAWKREGNTLIGQLKGKQKARLIQGDSTWVNYEFSVHATLKDGYSLQFPFRITEDGKGFYFVEFDYSWQSLNVTLRQPGQRGVTKLSVVNYPLKIGQEYHLIISARHRSITTYIDGQLINQVTDPTYKKGGVGLAMWWKSRAQFRDPKIRHYKWP